MIKLKFEANGQQLRRVDSKNIVAFARNQLYAEFILGDEWRDKEPVAAQFKNGDNIYDVFVENGVCQIPWEVLQDRGILSVALFGGDLLTTNKVNISVLSTGVIGGLIPTASSPSVYKYITELAEEISKGNFSDRAVRVKKLYFGDETEDNYAVIDLGSETGIRILNNLVKDPDWFIKIGEGESTGEIDSGIQFESTGEFIVKAGSDIIRLTGKGGAQNIIKGNETLRIVSDNASISFDSEDAGINYTKDSWTENFKQLDINTSKGVNIQANNNSYFQTGEKKLVLGNNFNQVEFRTDGVAKFNNTVNVKDLQIGGTSVLKTVDEKIDIAIDNYKKNISVWSTVQQLVKLGLGAQLFPVGTQLKCNHSEYGEIVWDVVDHNNNLDPTGSNPYSMTLYTHDILDKVVFDGYEALYYCETQLNSGTYNFTLISGWREDEGGGKTYQFTLNNLVPAGGVIVFPWGYGVQAQNVKVSTYRTITDSTAIETVGLAEGCDGISLGVADGTTTNMNHTHRTSGSSNWKESAIRQYLNSSNQAGQVWTPQNKFDRAPDWATNKNGFIYGLDSDFLTVVGEVDNTTVCNNIYESDGNTGGCYVTRDKFWLPSVTEVYNKVNVIAEGRQFEYYAGAENDKFIKYNSSGASGFQVLRSAEADYCTNVYRVSQYGGCHSSKAMGAMNIAVACTIY